jgi:hypothetical protein
MALIAVASLSAGARTSSTKALATDLLPSSYAKGIASPTRRRGQYQLEIGRKVVPSQGDLIHPVFKCHLSGVVSELLECRTEAAAAKILRGVVAET